MGVMDERRRMIAAQPHLVSVSGTALSVELAEPKIERVRINLGFQQSGSGVPSVNNVRTIVGWTDAAILIDGVSLTVNPASLGSVLHGYYDTKTGIRWADCTSQTLSGSSTGSISSYSSRGTSSIFWGYCGNLTIYNTENMVLSNMFTFGGYGYNYDGVADWTICGSSSYPNSFWVKLPTSALSAASLDGAKAWVTDHPIQVVSKRASGTTETSIGTKQITLARGPHTITAGAGLDSVDVDYWAH